MKLTVLQPIRVNGKEYKKGKVVDFKEETANVLLEHGWVKKYKPKK